MRKKRRCGVKSGSSEVASPAILKILWQWKGQRDKIILLLQIINLSQRRSLP